MGLNHELSFKYMCVFADFLNDTSGNGTGTLVGSHQDPTGILNPSGIPL